MRSEDYRLLGVFVLVSVGAAMVAALLVDTTTVPEFAVDYGVRVLLTVVIVGGIAVLVDTLG
jgi:hypothetical protein